jgi:hypothetical protein
MPANLQVVVDIQNKVDGLDQEVAQLQAIRGQVDAINQSTATSVDLEQSLSAAIGEQTTIREQQLAIEYQQQVIASGRLELIAAEQAGETARASLLKSELEVNAAVLGVMRSRNLSQTELNALITEEAALLKGAAAANEATATSSLLVGVNISKARAEATTLGRELLTGMSTTRTFGSLLSALGPTLGIAAVAGFGLYEIFVKSSAEAKKMTEEIEKENIDLQKQVQHWTDLALVAKDFQDVVRLGEKIDPELDKASEKLDELQKKSLGFGQAIEDVLIDAYKGFGPQIGLPDVNTNRDATDAAAASQKALNAELLRQANIQVDIAQDSSALWQDYKDGVTGAADVTKSLEIQIQNVQKVLDGLDRNKSKFDFQEWVRFDSLLILLQQHLKQVQNDSADEKEKAQRREVNDLLKQEQTLLQGIKDDQEIVSRNPFLSADAKNDQLHTLALREQAEVLKEIALVEAEIAKIKAIGDPQQQAQVEQLTQKLQSLRTQNQLLGFQIKETGTFSDQMTADLSKWVQSFGTSAHQISGLIEGSINAALQGTNQLLLDSIFRTGNWRQAFLGVEEQIASLFLKWIEQMALQQIAQMMGITTTTQAQTASGAQIAAAHAPAAAATSISSYGAAAIIGEVLAIAAIGAIIAAVSGAFHEGGMVETGVNRRGRTGPMSSDERLVLALEGEGIFTEDQMDYLYPTDPGKFKPEQLDAMGGGLSGTWTGDRGVQPVGGKGGGPIFLGPPVRELDGGRSGGPAFIGPPVRVPPTSQNLMESKFGRGPALGGIGHSGLIVAHGGLVIDPDDENNPLNWFTSLGQSGWIEAGGFLGMFGGSAQATPNSGGITATGYPGMFPDASPTSDPSGAGLAPSSLGSSSQALIDFWSATSQFGTYGVDWFYDVNGDPKSASYFDSTGTTPSAPPSGSSGTGVGGGAIVTSGTPFGSSPGAFKNGTWLGAGSAIGTSFGSMGYSLAGVPGTFVTTPSGQTYSTAVGMFGLGAMNAAGGSWSLTGAGYGDQFSRSTSGADAGWGDLGAIDDKMQMKGVKYGATFGDYDAPGAGLAKPGKANASTNWLNSQPTFKAPPGVYDAVTGTANLIGPTTGAALDDLSGGAIGPKGKKFHGGGSIDEMNITAQVGEFMQSKRAVDHYGINAMQAINSLQVPINRIKLHDGGPVGGPFAGSSRGAGGDGLFSINVHSYTDMEAVKQAVINSDANKDFVINTVTGQAHEVGLSS